MNKTIVAQSRANSEAGMPGGKNGEFEGLRGSMGGRRGTMGRRDRLHHFVRPGVIVASQTYRVQFSRKPAGQSHSAADVETVDLQADLDGIPGLLPPGAYIMYVEDLTAGQNVHWTRWPHAYRPGFGG